jgi:glutamate-5-semialdehyde dehydrogenase
VLKEIGEKAIIASKEINQLDTDTKNHLISDMSQQLIEDSDLILEANKKDLDNAKELDLSTALVDRLTLTRERIEGMSVGLKKIIPLRDPVGEVTKSWTTDDGLNINKVRSPFGVIGIIYEARPNVTSDVSALCIKSGNAVILKGSSYCLDSNSAILNSLQKTLEKNKINKDAIQLIKSKEREDTIKFMKLTEYIDLIVPRGGKGLINTLVDNAKVPFILDGDGNVHLYVHDDANPKYIIDIIINSKVQRPGVCNALETLILNKSIYKKMGKEIIKELLKNNVELFVDEIMSNEFPDLEIANEQHYMTEFHDLKLAIKIVEDLDEAIHHIEKYSSGHTEAIISESNEVANIFSKSIDSSVIFINASTRFTDGEMFGFGAEVGISTQKLHARGPMGLESLTNERYVVEGSGTVRK